MEKSLKLSEKLFCLAVRPVSGGIFLTATSGLAISLTGAVFIELLNLGLLSLDKKYIHINDRKLHTDPIHEYFLRPVRERQEARKLSRWIGYFNMKGRKIQKMFIRELVRKGVLRTEERRIFFIPYEKVFLKNQQLGDSLRREVEQTALGIKPAEEETVILTLLAHKINLLPQIIKDRQQRKLARKKLKDFPENQMTRAVEEAIESIRTAMVILAT